MAEIPQQMIALLEKKVGTGGNSPLFAQLASYYVQQGKAKEALRLCDEGLAAFPHYTTGHLVKGKALLALKMNAEARREFEIVQDFLPANRSVAFILSNIEPGEGETLTAPPAEPAVFQPTSDVTPYTSETSAPSVEEATPVQETPVPEVMESTTPTSEQAPPSDFFGTDTSTPATDDPFGFGSVASAPGAAGDTQAVPAESEPNPFEGFPSQPEPQIGLESQPTAESHSSASVFDFGAPVQEGFAQVSGEESFESFAVRMRGELGGGENSITLDDYLNSPSDSASEIPPEPTAANPIEDLADKLQSAKKITPVINFASKSTTPASEADTPASTGFVTPTLAEIYAKQGWYDDAIKAYRTLCVNKPAERERFEQRIAELEEMKKQQG